MRILPYIDIFETCYNLRNISKHKLVFDAIYNSYNSICLSKKYIEFIEQTVSDKIAFHALITELYDTNRIEISNSASKTDLKGEFLEIAKNHNCPILIPLAFNNSADFSSLKTIAIVNGTKQTDKNRVLLQLISQGVSNRCHSDFKNDKHIQTFFDEIFEIPRFIRQVYVFDREQVGKYLEGLRKYHISYYSLMRVAQYERRQIKKELKTILGGKLKLYSTNRGTLLHERKIIFEGLIITIDNSRINLAVSEPTWEIFICYDEVKSKEWIDKCKHFQEVYD